jgi:hypothetical protein
VKKQQKSTQKFKDFASEPKPGANAFSHFEEQAFI